jgi:prophage tail gpP-like protein
MPTEKVRLAVDGVTYADWYSVDIDSDLFTPADAFSVTGRLPSRDTLRKFREGATLDVYMTDDRQMSGVIDTVSTPITRKKASISVSGRDKGAFLIDTEAKHIKAANYNLKTLAEKLLQPAFGIRSVIVSNEDNRKLLLGKRDRGSKSGQTSRGRSVNPFTGQPRTLTHVDPGQKIAQILEEHCRRNGVTYWMTAGGDLYIGKPNYSQEPAFQFVMYAPGSRESAGNNVLEADVVRSIEGRYSEIAVIGQTTQGAANIFNPTTMKGSKFRGVANDPDLTSRGITRKLILTDGDCDGRKMAQARADYEQGLRRLKALELKLTVPGFRQNGRLFTIDTLATVKIEEADINGTYYITQRRFIRDRKQDRTEITLHEKGVYLA